MKIVTERLPGVLTTDQAADYLQLDRATIYRYIQDGKLPAFRMGRNLRIPRESLELLLRATQTRQDIPLREYSHEEVAAFIADDQLDAETTQIAQHFNSAFPH
ncbi:MAG: helix-turn-helix domain-containing protein [Chloroflexota bacterium]